MESLASGHRGDRLCAVTSLTRRLHRDEWRLPGRVTVLVTPGAEKGERRLRRQTTRRVSSSLFSYPFPPQIPTFFFSPPHSLPYLLSLSHILQFIICPVINVFVTLSVASYQCVCCLVSPVPPFSLSCLLASYQCIMSADVCLCGVHDSCNNLHEFLARIEYLHVKASFSPPPARPCTAPYCMHPADDRPKK